MNFFSVRSDENRIAVCSTFVTDVKVNKSFKNVNRFLNLFENLNQFILQTKIFSDF